MAATTISGNAGGTKLPRRDDVLRIMVFPITTFKLEVDERWAVISEFANRMYGISVPELDQYDVMHADMPMSIPAMSPWLAIASGMRSDSGFHFFDFTPQLDESLGLVIANFNDYCKWAIDTSDSGLVDPPINCFQYVASKRHFVLRKMSRAESLTHWVLELLIEFGGISHIGAPLSSPSKFVRELRAYCSVSERIGNIYLTGSDDWYATISCGASPFGGGKYVVLRYKDDANLTQVPKILLDTVGKTSGPKGT